MATGRITQEKNIFRLKRARGGGDREEKNWRRRGDEKWTRGGLVVGKDRKVRGKY